MTPCFRTSRPCTWVEPRWTDPAARYQRHGPILPMDEPMQPTLLRRILGKVK